MGQIWYSYILNGDNSYFKVDPGTLAGAVEDAFLFGPLYIATGIGLLLPDITHEAKSGPDIIITDERMFPNPVNVG